MPCVFWVLFFLFNLFVGAWSVNYVLFAFLGKTLPFLGAMLIGLFAAEVSVPVAIVVWLLKAFGVM